MAPREVDVDQQQAEGAIIYKIGGRRWVAEEPRMGTMRAVLEATPMGKTEVEKADGELDEEATRTNTLQQLGSLWDQLAILLREKTDGDELGTAPDPAWLEEHLSIKRAGNIIGDILGEGPAALRV